jgi:hypothetical protein
MAAVVAGGGPGQVTVQVGVHSTWDVTLLVLLLAQRGLDQVVAAVDDVHARGGCLQRSGVDQGMHGAHGASLLPARSPDIATGSTRIALIRA